MEVGGYEGIEYNEPLSGVSTGEELTKEVRVQRSIPPIVRTSRDTSFHAQSGSRSVFEHPHAPIPSSRLEQ
jgi:hypothetical protein